MAFGQDRGLAHPAQVGHQLEGMVVAHGHPVDVGHRQGEAGALEEAGRVGGVGEGRDPRPRPAGQLQLGGGQGLAQLGQGRPAEQGADEEAIWLQRQPRLDKGADDVVGPVQGQAGDDKVQAGRGEGQALLVGLDAQPAATGQHGPRQVRLDQQAHPGRGVALRQGLGEGAVAGAEVDGAGEVAHDGLQAHHDVPCGAAFQEVGPGEARGGPVQPPAQEVAVEDPGGRDGGRHGPRQ